MHPLKAGAANFAYVTMVGPRSIDLRMTIVSSPAYQTGQFTCSVEAQKIQSGDWGEIRTHVGVATAGLTARCFNRLSFPVTG